MANQLDKSKPGWWAEEQESKNSNLVDNSKKDKIEWAKRKLQSLNPKPKNKVDKILDTLYKLENSNESVVQMAKDIHFIAKALKVWIGLMVVGLTIWIVYLFFYYN